MNFGQAISTCFKNYATFTGRASRPEFWWFFLFQLLVSLATSMVSDILNGLAMLALLLPGLAVGARRLHDIGKSAWLLLLWLIPLIGWVILIVWACQKSDPAGNVYGPPPGDTPLIDASPGAV
ncbi:MAG: DUF805 domain-containing protein [Burkholderiaceae bacterium]|nr:DUF805 domain-containing protein [Burkholderiaceae bacterium]